MSYQKQVNKEHYSFEKYFYPGRWMSYWYQTKEISCKQDIKTVLDIGSGTTFMHDILKIHRPDIEYKTLDIAKDIKPDFIGEVTAIPLPDSSYDAVTAFQVLEHIEFSDFESALLEMKRVSKNTYCLVCHILEPPLNYSFEFRHLLQYNYSLNFRVLKLMSLAANTIGKLAKKGIVQKKSEVLYKSTLLFLMSTYRLKTSTTISIFWKRNKYEKHYFSN